QSRFQQPGERFPFRGREHDVLSVLPGPGQVQFGVGYVKVANQDHRLFGKGFEAAGQPFVTFQLVAEMFLGPAAVRKVGVYEIEAGVFELKEASFLVEAVNTERSGYGKGFCLGVYGDSGVAFFGGEVEIGRITWNGAGSIGQLAFLKLYFLKAQKVRADFLGPWRETAFFNGAQAVYVPTDDVHGF